MSSVCLDGDKLNESRIRVPFMKDCGRFTGLNCACCLPEKRLTESEYNRGAKTVELNDFVSLVSGKCCSICEKPVHTRLRTYLQTLSRDYKVDAEKIKNLTKASKSEDVRTLEKAMILEVVEDNEGGKKVVELIEALEPEN